MPYKSRPQRRIDASVTLTGGATIETTVDNPAPPALPDVDAPTGLALTTALQRSAVTPMALISATWDPTPGEPSYMIQWSEDSGFPDGETSGMAAGQASATILNLHPATTYYVRVAAVYRAVQSGWSASVSIATPSDTTAPSAPSSPAASFNAAGDLIVTWSNPASANFRDAEIVIWNSSGKTVQYQLAYDATGRYVWTAAQNRAAGSGAADASVYVELRSRSYGGTYSSAVNASATKSVPSTPGSVTATWDGASGTASWTWASVGDAVTYRLTIDGMARDVNATVYHYDVGKNRQEHSGTADASLAWSLVAVDGLGQVSTASTGTATLAAPGTPGSVVQSWASDAGTAGGDWVITWGAVSGAASYRLTIDSVARDLLATRYTYPFRTNVQEHSGTADPALSYSLVAVDGLGQVSSTPASGTATNAAPATVSCAITAFFNTLSIAIGTSAAADLRDYRIRVYRDAGLIDTLSTESTLLSYAATTSGSYTADATVYDLFGQASSATLSSAATLDGLTIADLRAEAIYSDSASRASSVLKANLAADSAGTVHYTAGASWTWTQVRRELLARYRAITWQMTNVDATGGPWFYLATSEDGTTWRYFAGPVTSSRVLTEVASQAAAETAKVAITSISGTRVDLPGTVEARYVTIFHSAATSGKTFQLNRFYPRRVVQSDDMEAEAIKALHIGAASITADRLSVSQLSAITGDMGALTAGTITGATIRTASSGARVELNSTKIFGTDGSTTQWEALSSTGELTAGAGNVVLNSSGLSVQSSTGYVDSRSVRFTYTSAGTVYTLSKIYSTRVANEVKLVLASLYSDYVTTNHIIELSASDASRTVTLSIDPNNSYVNISHNLVAGNITATGDIFVDNALTVTGNAIIKAIAPGSNNLTIVPASTAYVTKLGAPAWSLRLGEIQAGHQFISVGVEKTGADNNYIAQTGNNTAVDHLIEEYTYNGVWTIKGQAHQSDGTTLSPTTTLSANIKNQTLGVGKAAGLTGAGDIDAAGNIRTDKALLIKDGISAPATVSGYGTIFIDSADGDLKIKYGDGTVKTIVVDT